MNEKSRVTILLNHGLSNDKVKMLLRESYAISEGKKAKVLVLKMI